MTLRLTRAQVREVDRLAIEKYHVPGIVLMENAARAVVDVCLDELRGVANPKAAVVCGGGNNGGDGFAAARHLHNRGVEVIVSLFNDAASYRGDALINLQIVRAMNLRIEPYAHAHFIAPGSAHLIVDAIFGTGLEQPPRQPLDEIVNLLRIAGRSYGKPIVAVDLPSGLDCDAGTPLGQTIFAKKTVTFVAEKAGFANPEAKQYTGEVVVGDIGCPRRAIDEARGL